MTPEERKAYRETPHGKLAEALRWALDEHPAWLELTRGETIDLYSGILNKIGSRLYGVVSVSRLGQLPDDWRKK